MALIEVNVRGGNMLINTNNLATLRVAPRNKKFIIMATILPGTEMQIILDNKLEYDTKLEAETALGTFIDELPVEPGGGIPDGSIIDGGTFL